MNITENLIRISKAKDDIKQSLRDKGIAVPEDALLDEYSSIIDETELYGPTYKDLYDIRTNNGTNMTGLYARTTGELDLRQLDTSKATTMYYMFDYSNANVNIDGWDTKNVTDMSYMFSNFSGSIDISKLDTSSVKNVSDMFYYANTDNIILTGLSFPGTTKLNNMFENAKGTTIDLSSWDISNITNMYNMFSGAGYKRIDLTGWKTTNVTNMGSMFYGYSNPIEELIIPDWDMTNTTSYSSFYYVGNSSNKNTLRLVDLSRSNDVTITKIASCLPTRTATTYGDVIVPSNTPQATYDAITAKYWRPIGASMTPVPTSTEIIAELDELKPGKPRTTRVCLGNWDPWYADTSKVEIVMTSSESIATIEGDTITSTGITGDIVLEARIIDTQEVISTKTIPVTETDSYPNVIKLRFIGAPASYTTVTVVNGSSKALSDLTYDSIFDIYSYDAGAPITSIKFFDSLGELVKLNISNITSMRLMFDNCKLTSLDLSNWDTSNVTTMESMFTNCTNLTTLDISNFNTSNVTNMSYMFRDCTSLTTLDLSNFDTSEVTNTTGMFWGCRKLHTLHLDNCSNDTINKIITSSYFPTNHIDGIKGTIYCKKENAAGLTPPTNWVFEYIEAEPETPDNTIVVYTVNDANKTALTHVQPKAADWEETVIDNEDGTYTVFATGSELPNMLIFSGNTALVSVSYINTSAVFTVGGMFGNCTGLINLDLSNFDANNIQNMGSMLQGCTGLQTLRLENCTNNTISKIITSSGFPVDNYGTIYCKESEADGLTPPGNWVFSYID